MFRDHALPLESRTTTPSSVGDLRASACAYVCPIVYTCVHESATVIIDVAPCLHVGAARGDILLVDICACKVNEHHIPLTMRIARRHTIAPHMRILVAELTRAILMGFMSNMQEQCLLRPEGTCAETCAMWTQTSFLRNKCCTPPPSAHAK